MFAFAGQIFNLLPDMVMLIIDNYGFNFTLKHPLSLWKVQNDTFENLVLGPKLFWAKVSVGPFFHNFLFGQASFYLLEPTVNTELCRL